MNAGPSVIVNKKSGFFAAVAKGLFGTLIAAIVCVSVLGIFGIRLVERNVGIVQDALTTTLPEVLRTIPEVVDRVPNLVRALPPVLADGLNDRRAPEYEQNLAIKTRVVETRRSSRGAEAVIEVTNQGDEAVSLLMLRLTIEDDREVPIDEHMIVVATPLAIEDEMRGPLWPGNTRKIAQWVCSDPEDVTAVIELAELRLWNGPMESAEEDVSLADAEETGAE